MIMIQPTVYPTHFFNILHLLLGRSFSAQEVKCLRFAWNKQKKNSAVIKGLTSTLFLSLSYRNVLTMMTFSGGGRSSVASLFCPMLMWVYYISIDFLPCFPLSTHEYITLTAEARRVRGLCTGQCGIRRKIKKLYRLHSDQRSGGGVFGSRLFYVSLALWKIQFFSS